MFLSPPLGKFCSTLEKVSSHPCLSFLIGLWVKATSRSVAKEGAIGYLYPQSKIAKHMIEFSFQTLFTKAGKKNFFKQKIWICTGQGRFLATPLSISTETMNKLLLISENVKNQILMR
jgi:hypothetical protein